MKRIKPLSHEPVKALSIAPDVKIAFIIDILEASLPLFQNKDPQNPIDTSPSDDSNNNSTTT